MRNYDREVLSLLNPKGTVLRLKQLANSDDIAIICYEATPKSEEFNKDNIIIKINELVIKEFCHRHLVSQWLRLSGYEVEEWR